MKNKYTTEELKKDFVLVRGLFPDYDSKDGIDKLIALCETRCKRQNRTDLGIVMTQIQYELTL